VRKRTHNKLGKLDSIQVTRPCDTDWELMSGDDRVRFCEACQKNVYNLSA
jgi:hypothetical protein